MPRKTYSHGPHTLSHHVGWGTENFVSLDRLFESGEVNQYTLPTVVENLVATRILQMVADSHPLTKKLQEAQRSDEEIANTVGMFGIQSLIFHYLAEKEVNVCLILSDSQSMKGFLRQVADNRVLAEYYDLAGLQRSLPSLVQASFNEAKVMISAIVQDKAAQQARSAA